MSIKLHDFSVHFQLLSLSGVEFYQYRIMAYTILLFTAFIAASVNAAFVWQNDDDFGKRHEFKFHHLTFPPFPTFRPFPHLTFPTFPPFPTIPPIVIPSPADIAKNKGKNFNGISVSSSSSSTVDKDGKVIQTGGTTIVTNNDGVVKEFVFGDNPPKISLNPHVIIPQQVPILQPLPIPMPITPEAIKNMKPKSKNEKFVSSASSFFTKATDINGVKRSVGGGSVVSNVNGNVKENVDYFESNTV